MGILVSRKVMRGFITALEDATMDGKADAELEDIMVGDHRDVKRGSSR
jgi:hypothetical protein